MFGRLLLRWNNLVVDGVQNARKVMTMLLVLQLVERETLCNPLVHSKELRGSWKLYCRLDCSNFVELRIMKAWTLCASVEIVFRPGYRSTETENSFAVCGE